jgi:hypothetical protein
MRRRKARSAEVTQDYLIGEVSICLQRLEAAAGHEAAGDVMRLRHEVEAGPPAGLTAAVARALAVADGMCWASLGRGDAEAFMCQARASEDLRQFATYARLIADF